MKPGYKQTEIGVIPEDWEISAIKDIGILLSGDSPSKLSEGDVPFFKVDQLNNTNKYQTETPYHVKVSNPMSTGSIIFPKRGAAIGTNKIRIISQDSYVDTNIMALTITDKDICSEYIYYWLLRKGLGEIADTTSIPQINNKHVYPLKLPRPSVVEQQRIAESLSDMDEMIASLEKLIAKKKAIKQGAMQELLTGKRRMPGFSRQWKTAKWKDVLSGFISGATPYRGKPEYYEGEVKWVSSGELNYIHIIDTVEHISNSAVAETCLCVHPAGTFLMAITGLEAAGTRGSCAILDVPAATNQSCMAIYSTEKMSVLYLYYYYLKYGNDLAFRYCQGTKQQSYTAAIVKELPISYPEDVLEQNAIAEYLIDLDNNINLLEQKHLKACQIKQGMMQQLLTGKIRLM